MSLSQHGSARLECLATFGNLATQQGITRLMNVAPVLPARERCMDGQRFLLAGPSSISARLNDLKIRTRYGKEWNEVSVYRLLKA